MQDNQDKTTNTDEVETEYKRIQEEEEEEEEETAVGATFFRTHSDHPWVPPDLL
jgi:hypothetical protein